MKNKHQSLSTVSLAQLKAISPTRTNLFPSRKRAWRQSGKYTINYYPKATLDINSTCWKLSETCRTEIWEFYTEKAVLKIKSENYKTKWLFYFILFLLKVTIFKLFQSQSKVHFHFLFCLSLDWVWFLNNNIYNIINDFKKCLDLIDNDCLVADLNVLPVESDIRGSLGSDAINNS